MCSSDLNPHPFLRFNILTFQIHNNHTTDLKTVITQVELKEKQRTAKHNHESKRTQNACATRYLHFVSFKHLHELNYRCIMTKIDVYHSMQDYYRKSNDKSSFELVRIILSTHMNRI